MFKIGYKNCLLLKFFNENVYLEYFYLQNFKTSKVYLLNFLFTLSLMYICLYFRCTHDTPSRIPLIWRNSEDTQESTIHPTTVSVPTLLVASIFVFYICAGAVVFSSTTGWSFLDSLYFCFITISTVGVGDKLPQSSEFHAQLQLFACCLYLIVGLMVVSMCFSLLQEEVTHKCRQFANNIGLAKD